MIDDHTVPLTVCNFSVIFMVIIFVIVACPSGALCLGAYHLPLSLVALFK